ncbi:MAG: elongation factor G [Pirellulaceae bacterium]
MLNKVEDIRNVAICGHGSAGKTSLIDKILVKTGAVNGHPSVDQGTSICDFDPEEKHHKYSIEAALVHCNHGGKRFNIIDTPGYPDFIGQTICSLHGVDNAVIAINAHVGLQVNTRRVFEEAGKENLGRFLLITKMDADNIDFPALIESIREMWGNKCVLVNVPVGHGAEFQRVVSTLHVPDDTAGALMNPQTIHDSLIESVIEVDEEVMAKYLEGNPPTPHEVARLLVKAIAAGSLIPILCCSTKLDIGVTEFLDFLAEFGLTPADITRTASHQGATYAIEPKADAPLVARVFRTRIDPFVQKLSFIRIYTGTMKKDDTVHVAGARKGVKLGPPLTVQGGESHAVEAAGPGDIVALAKMEDLHTGTVLGDAELPPFTFPTPMVGLAVTPKSRGDETKLSGALHKVAEEDQTFRIDRDAQTKETVMTGMSELHLTIIRERLHRRDKLDVDTHEPKIPFRETIQAPAEGMYRHKKQTGGRGQFGEVHIRMYPLPRSTNLEEWVNKERFPQLKQKHYDEKHNFLWVDSVVGGVIPGNFMPAIEKGFKERLEGGVIAGYMVQDLCVEVFFGKHHPVDSSEAAFKTAARMAFRNVFQQAKPCLLEPVVKLAITVPESNVGDVYSDMSGRGGRVQGSDSAGGNLQTIFAEAPLREVTSYARTLSSMTGGQGSYAMEFSHYDVMPSSVQHDIMAKAKMHEEEEE